MENKAPIKDQIHPSIQSQSSWAAIQSCFLSYQAEKGREVGPQVKVSTW